MKLALILLLMLFATPALAQTVPSVSVTGYAEDKIEPDKAMIHVEVYTESKELAAAKKEQDEKVKKLLALAVKHGAKKDDIRTLHANVQPQYDYVNESGNRNKRVFRAYTLSNNVEVILRDLDNVGSLMDALVNAKFERINNVQFGLENQRKHQEALMTEALAHAKDKASSMAAALGATVGKPISVSESGAYVPPQPMPMMRAAMADGAAMMESKSMSSYSPAGVIEIQQTVNVTFELK